jgi:hypothetical protein
MPVHLCLRIVSALVCLLLGMHAGNATAEPSGDRYRVKSTFEMPGMPFQMPAQSTEVCTAKEGSASMVPHDKDCRVSAFSRSGNKSTFRIECSGENAMTGQGETEQLGPDAYRGSIRAVSKAEGETMDMTIRFEGKRIGGCDYATESPEAIGKAMVAQTCESQIDSAHSHRMFVGAEATCATLKPKYCANLVRQADALVDPKKFPKHDIGFPWAGYEACGRPRAVIVAKACSAAQAGGDLDFIGAQCPALLTQACSAADPRANPGFVAQSCPEQARALAAQHCAGRGYTAMSTSPYRDFCGRQASRRLQERNADPATPAGSEAPVGEPAATPAKPGMRERLKGLKDRLGGG